MIVVLVVEFFSLTSLCSKTSLGLVAGILKPEFTEKNAHQVIHIFSKVTSCQVDVYKDVVFIINLLALNEHDFKCLLYCIVLKFRECKFVIYCLKLIRWDLFSRNYLCSLFKCHSYDKP